MARVELCAGDAHPARPGRHGTFPGRAPRTNPRRRDGTAVAFDDQRGAWRTKGNPRALVRDAATLRDDRAGGRHRGGRTFGSGAGLASQDDRPVRFPRAGGRCPAEDAWKDASSRGAHDARGSAAECRCKSRSARVAVGPWRLGRGVEAPEAAGSKGSTRCHPPGGRERHPAHDHGSHDTPQFLGRRQSARRPARAPILSLHPAAAPGVAGAPRLQSPIWGSPEAGGPSSRHCTQCRTTATERPRTTS